MWTKEQACAWMRQHPWVVGFNYVPAYAVNSTEMWQQERFDIEQIRRELTAAATVGYNACRVFLPYILWHGEHDSFMRNVETFVETAGELAIAVVPVLFDDCAFSHKEPYLGVQNDPVKGIHNSGWTPSPGFTVSDDLSARESLKHYVCELVTRYAHDERILFWDLYNEPGNSDREEKCLPLLHDSFEWARECSPDQPLTACVWIWKAFDLECLALSDVISYHDYTELETTKKRVEPLLADGRPVFCTEWLHREAGNHFETHLPYYQEHGIGIFQWGLVQGRTQTNLSWQAEKNCFDGQPAVWQHDVFFPDLRAYRPCELELLAKETCVSLMQDVPISIPIRDMTPELMQELEDRGLILRMTPGRHRFEIPEGDGVGRDLYISRASAGPHKLISVAISRTQFSAFGFHEENEEFLLLGGEENERPLLLLVALCDASVLRRKLAQGTADPQDFICLRCRFNDPQVSFFVMKKGVPHGEAAEHTNGLPSTFYVTESAGIHLIPLPVNCVANQ